MRTNPLLGERGFMLHILRIITRSGKRKVHISKAALVLVEEKRTSKPIKTTYTFVEDVSPRILKYDLNKQLIRRSHNKVPRQSKVRKTAHHLKETAWTNIEMMSMTLEERDSCP